jgi:hypothetical protein
MNKASSALLATAGMTVGLLGVALPAGAATAAGPNSGGSSTPSSQQITNPPNIPGGSAGNNQSNNNQGKNDRGRDNRGGQKPEPGPIKTKSPCPVHTHKPCPPRTKNPCPPKPCQPVVTKPCKPRRDKDGHLTSYREQPKHVLVCKPKPCPTKAKPCPPRCKKHTPHKHPCKPKHPVY